MRVSDEKRRKKRAQRGITSVIAALRSPFSSLVLMLLAVNTKCKIFARVTWRNGKTTPCEG